MTTISTEQFTSINVGTSINDGTGDSLRNAFIKVNQNFANISDTGVNTGNISCQGTIEILGNLILQEPSVPATSNAAGAAGQITWDSNYIYICVATNTWKRASLATW
jgi:hypothetical protein